MVEALQYAHARSDRTGAFVTCFGLAHAVIGREVDAPNHRCQDPSGLSRFRCLRRLGRCLVSIVRLERDALSRHAEEVAFRDHDGSDSALISHIHRVPRPQDTGIASSTGFAATAGACRPPRAVVAATPQAAQMMARIVLTDWTCSLNNCRFPLEDLTSCSFSFATRPSRDVEDCS